MYVGMRDGVANIDGVGTGIILRDPGDIINQFYLQDVLRNPHNWQNDRVDELIDLQNRAIDPSERQGHLEELASTILHRGESHWLPVFWGSNGGAFDYRIRNYYYPPTVQLIKKWGPRVVRSRPRNAIGSRLRPIIEVHINCISRRGRVSNPPSFLSG